MNQRSEYFKQAELALAAYANLTIGEPDRNELERIGFSTIQALDSFIPTYRVVAQHTDATGLSATVFADNVTGETFLAIRGTEVTDAGDMLANLTLATLGSFNLNLQYASIKAQVTQWLLDGLLPPNFTVKGHSLGGYLATGLTADFATNVTHAYLFNAPGLGGVLGSMVLGVLGVLDVTTTPDPSKISNIEASTGVSPIAGLGFDAAPPIDIIIEDQTQISDSPPSKNHSQQALTDAFDTAEENASRSYTSEWRLAA